MIALGVQTWGTDLPALRRFWQAADALGYARIVYGDGLWSFTHDGWTMLAALAALTRRARIGPAVTYAFDSAAHHPSWLAKRAVAIDHLSGGRLDVRLGVGAQDAATAAAWAAHGIAYPSAGERVTRLDEAVAVLGPLLAGERVSHRGRCFTLRDARIEPPPVQRPRPPIWVAAMGPRALDLVARRADGWEASYLPPPEFGDRWARLQALLARVGRSPASLKRAVEVDVVLAATMAEAAGALARFRENRGIGREHPVARAALAGDATAIAEGITSYRTVGVTDLTLAFADFPATGMLERLAALVRPPGERSSS
jgi:alkanesulfonate monooxygenase SsuD/methylene tetrahydromethanopterin reductase-like flavin-dependent oxidoreductase (luciferase family)